ncbi:MAG: F0F1 ATP synthase subunit epsilon [Dehalococcoidia bacterium]
MATFNLTIVTAEREILSVEADTLVAPGIDGELTVLPNHAPLLTELKPGEISLGIAGDETSLVVSGGFLEVLGNRVLILADAAERDQEIDLDRAETALARAQERLASRTADLDLDRALRAIGRAQIRLRVAERRTRRRSTAALGPAPVEEG